MNEEQSYVVIALLGWIVFQGPIRYWAWQARKHLYWRRKWQIMRWLGMEPK